MLTLLLAVIDSPEDQTLFEAVYNKYRGQLLGIAISMLNDHQLAEDAVSETMWKTALNFEKLLVHLRGDSGREQLDTNDVLCPRTNGFVVIVLKNICRDMLRKGKKESIVFYADEAALDSLCDESEDGTEDRYISSENALEITRTVEGLSETLRYTMYLYIVLEFSIEETAEILGCSYETIKKRIQRGRKELQRALEGNNND